MKINQEKIPVIYLLSAGHSGSTIIDFVMNSHSKICGVGELFKYSRLKREGYFCSCRKAFVNCPFWKKVFSDLDQKINLEVYRNKIDFLLNKKRYFGSHYHRLVNIKKYIEFNEKIYENILKYSGRKVVFDSSKHPQRLELLLNSKKLDITILHLVRDGRGVAWSYYNKYKTPAMVARSGSHHNKYKRLAMIIKSWLMRNLKIEIVRRRNKVKYIFIRYKDFTKNPKRVLNFILKNAGLSLEPQMMKFKSKDNHQVAGNILVRFIKQKEIKEDVRWKKEMPLFYKIIFNLLFGWLNLIYKHRKSL